MFVFCKHNYTNLTVPRSVFPLLPTDSTPRILNKNENFPERREISFKKFSIDIFESFP